MSQPTPVCDRAYAHLPHDTTVGRCWGVTPQQRPHQLAQHVADARAAITSTPSTPCPHPGCEHDAATPDRAHAMPARLVDGLLALTQTFHPEEIVNAAAALWPDTYAAELTRG